LMGSDTLPGTPAGDVKAVAVYEVKSAISPWNNENNWEAGAPDVGNGVMWLMSTAYQTNQPANFAFTFFYNFINTGPAVTGATMSCGVDNYAYIVLNGVKYPSTNTRMATGYEGITPTASFTVNIPPGLNTLELRAVNGGPGANVWENQGNMGGPTAAWMIIKSSTETLLIKTTNKWNCRQFDYPAKFVRPLSLGDVAENAGLSRPYSLAALSGKVMYDNSKNSTTLTSPVSLYTADFKTFVAPPFLIIISASYGERFGASGNVTSSLQARVNNQTSFSYTGGMGGGSSSTLFPGYDPYPYQAKDLRITYKNGTSGTVKTFYESADNNDMTSFTLSPSSPDNVSR
jgi:hypothetical protein